MGTKMCMEGYITYEQLIQLDDALAFFPDMERKILKHYNINDLADLPEHHFMGALEFVEQIKTDRKMRI